MTPTLTLGAAARMMREAYVKNRSYRATPLGLEVARYYRWKKNEWGASAETLRDYEAILAKTALFFADLELSDLAPPVGTERLRECWDFYWGERAPRTRAKIRSVWTDFFEWAVRERGLHGNPARPLTRPKIRDTEIKIFGPSMVLGILEAQTYPADWCLADLILHYGVRRSGLVNAQRKHFEVERRLFTCHTKGGRIYKIPIVEDTFWLKLGLLDLEAQLKPEDWILYRQDTRHRKVPLEDATEILQIGPNLVGYADIIRRDHTHQATGKIAHLWWYRALHRAGYTVKGQTAGANMHRGRHTAATELQRSRHDLKLTQSLLGHKDITSTARYAQLDTQDLADALTRMLEKDA